MKTEITGILLLIIFAFSFCHADDRIIIGGMDGLDFQDTSYSHSIGLALSGGGARGLASIGVIRAFEEKGIRIAAITGVSMGGIIGGLYASGYSPDSLISLAAKLEISGLFANAPPRKSMFLTQREEQERHLLSIRFNSLTPVIPKALTKGQKLTSLLTALTTRANYHSGSNFNHMPIPFKTITTDIVSGEEIIIDQGSLADAMRATMAFPLAFTAVEKDTQLLMDGGMLTPVPVELTRTMCPSTSPVVAVNTASRLLPKASLVTPVDIANQVTTIMTADKLVRQLSLADYVVAPPLDDFLSSDFKYRDTIIDIGYSTSLKAADSIIIHLQQNNHEHNYFIHDIIPASVSDSVFGFIRSELVNRSFTRKKLVTRLKQLASRHQLYRLECQLNDLDKTGNKHTISLVVSAIPAVDLSKVQIEYVGNTIMSDSILKKSLALSNGLLTPEKLRQGLNRIINRYHARGYDLAVVDSVNIDNTRQLIQISIDEAIIYRIDVTNNQRTRDWFVRSHFPLRVGQPYSTSQATKGIENIYGTNLFNRVSVDLERHPKGAIVKLNVTEKHYKQIRLGWHWDDEYQSEEFIELLDDNVLGMGLEYLLHARYAVDRQSYFSTFRANRIWSTYLTARFQLFHNRLNRKHYDPDGNMVFTRQEINNGASISFGQQIKKFGRVTASITAREVEYRYSDTASSKIFGLRTFTIESLVENLNRCTFPESGNRHLFQLQLTGKFLGGDEEYTRLHASLETFIPLGLNLNYHYLLLIGISRSGLPPSEKFYLGDLHSFAGFRTYQATGDKLLMLRNDLRLKLPLRLYFSLRHYIGEVYNHSDQIKLRNLRNAIGIVLALDSPIGPFEFGYGLADSDFERFYLNIGLQF